MDNKSNWSGSLQKGSNLQQYLAQFRNGQTMKTQDPGDAFGLKAKLANRLTGSVASPMNYNDYRSDFSGKDSKQYLVANAMGKPLKLSETPQMRVPNELDSYLNWVPTKEKFNLNSVNASKKKLNTLNQNLIYEDDSRRSSYSKTVLKGRDSRINFDKGDDISVDGFSLSAQKVKPRAISNFKTINGYKQPSSDFDTGSRAWGINSPAPKRGALDELPWEDRQKLLGMSLQQVNSLKKEDILQSITGPKSYASVGKARPFDDDNGSIDDVLRKLIRMGNNYSNLREYVRILIKRWDTNNDGIISFQEVCEGLRQMEINLQLKDRVALMKRLDLNKDGKITEDELYKVLSGSGGSSGDASVINQTLLKIAGGAPDATNLRQYARDLIRRFDTDSDGVVSPAELFEGLRDMNIYLSPKEREALLRKLDIDQDGSISESELFRALSSVDNNQLKLLSKEAADLAVKKLASGAEEFSSVREYVQYLFKKFDYNNDGKISFNELSDGLSSLGIYLNLKERQSLMKRFDVNRDGEVTAEELLTVISKVDSKFTSSQLDSSTEQTLRKIAHGAEKFGSLKEYVSELFTRFDKNRDGYISFEELCQGISSFQIFLSSQERKALMSRLDLNSDGEITKKEIILALEPYSSGVQRAEKVSPAQLQSSINQALVKIVGGADDVSKLREYSKTLIRRFDTDSDGVISYRELVEGLKGMHIFLNPTERDALMKKLDINQDGSISDAELFKALSSVDIKQLKLAAAEAGNMAVKKLASGAEDFPSMRDYVRHLISHFDSNSDGRISFEELSEGLSSLGIHLTAAERQHAMKKFDVNRDGEVTAEELLKVLSKVDVKFTKAQLDSSTEQTLRKIASGADKFGSLKDFTADLVNRFDRNQDGYVSFDELCQGIASFKIFLNQQEKKALMSKLDINSDGEITKDELYAALKAYWSGAKRQDTIPRAQLPQVINQTLLKILGGADDLTKLRDYARNLIRRFDTDSDGVISVRELVEGLKNMGIFLTPTEREGLMKKLDIDQDGSISETELFKALQSVDASQLKKMSSEGADLAIKKIAAGAEGYPSLKDYVRDLMRRFDNNNDGRISFEELSNGVRSLGISLTFAEKQSLMKKFDANLDGEISSEELTKVLSGASSKLSKSEIGSSMDQTLRRIAAGADKFSSLKEYTTNIVNRFDKNKDGYISFDELCQALASRSIYLSIQEKKALMNTLDLNSDGEITAKEIEQALRPYYGQDNYSKGGVQETIPQGQLQQVINQTLLKIAGGADDLSRLREYSRTLIRRFDTDQDGVISVNELCNGLRGMHIYLTQKEREALMRKLDIDQDGSISDAELYKALSSVNSDQLKKASSEAAEVAVKKIASGAEEFPSVKDYVRHLMQRFDANNDGAISFDELSDGVRSLGINLTLAEKQSLMKKFDVNYDGEVTAQELLNVISTTNSKLSKTQLGNSVDQVLRKMASGADQFGSMKEYIQTLVTRFDKNYDGHISFDELCAGLNSFQIFLTAQEKRALMNKLDLDKDGEITKVEIYEALRPYEEFKDASRFQQAQNRRSPSMSQDMKVSFKQKELERITVEEIIEKVKKSAQKYPSYKHFVSTMMRRYDSDNDGSLNFRELSQGLDQDGANLTHEEKLVLMKHLDADCDGVVTRDEIFHALLIDARHRRNHHEPKVNTDHLLRRIRQGAEKFKSVDEFVRYLFAKLDTDGSGSLSFNELSVGLTNMGIQISQKEKHALMQRLDDDADGEIGYEEFYNGLVGAGKFKQATTLNPSQAINVQHALKKIAIGAQQYKCLEDYIITLFKKFDVNKDGALSFKELREGLNSLNVHLADNEIHALFHMVDVDRDGEITQEELYNAVMSKEKNFKSVKIQQSKVNVDHVLNIIKKGVERFSSLDEYVKDLMRKFDVQGKGYITFDELGEGLKSINIKISEKEKLALMNDIDDDRNGVITAEELYNALSSSKTKDYNPSPARGGRQSPMQNREGVEQILAKIRKAVAHYKSVQEQKIALVKIFDLDGDGYISYLELVDGVKALGISAKKNDMIDLMNYVDIDKDGYISQTELYKALDLKAQTEGYQGTSASIDEVLIKLKRGSEKYRNLVEYVNYLFEQFASSNSSYMTFQELMNCLKTFNFNLTQVERIALMKKMDENGDNQISKDEFYNALISAGGGSGKNIPSRPTFGGASGATHDAGEEARIDAALLKIKAGAAKFKNLSEYCMHLIRKLDTNKDGYVSYQELAEGLRDMGIKLFKGEQASMMRRIDENRNGQISYDELLKALSRV